MHFFPKASQLIISFFCFSLNSFASPENELKIYGDFIDPEISEIPNSSFHFIDEQRLVVRKWTKGGGIEPSILNLETFQETPLGDINPGHHIGGVFHAFDFRGELYFSSGYGDADHQVSVLDQVTNSVVTLESRYDAPPEGWGKPIRSGNALYAYNPLKEGIARSRVYLLPVDGGDYQEVTFQGNNQAGARLGSIAEVTGGLLVGNRDDDAFGGYYEYEENLAFIPEGQNYAFEILSAEELGGKIEGIVDSPAGTFVIAHGSIWKTDGTSEGTQKLSFTIEGTELTFFEPEVINNDKIVSKLSVDGCTFYLDLTGEMHALKKIPGIIGPRFLGGNEEYWYFIIDPRAQRPWEYWAYSWERETVEQIAIPSEYNDHNRHLVLDHGLLLHREGNSPFGNGRITHSFYIDKNLTPQELTTLGGSYWTAVASGGSHSVLGIGGGYRLFNENTLEFTWLYFPRFLVNLSSASHLEHVVELENRTLGVIARKVTGEVTVETRLVSTLKNGYKGEVLVESCKISRPVAFEGLGWFQTQKPTFADLATLFMTDGTREGTQTLAIPGGNDFIPEIVFDEKLWGRVAAFSDGAQLGFVSEDRSSIEFIFTATDGRTLKGITEFVLFDGKLCFSSQLDEHRDVIMVMDKDGDVSPLFEPDASEVLGRGRLLQASGNVLAWVGKSGGVSRLFWTRKDANGTIQSTSFGRPLEFKIIGDQIYAHMDDFTAPSHRNLHGEMVIIDTRGASARIPRVIGDQRRGSYPSGFTSAGNKVFFTAENEAEGRELWVSDGTGQGTIMVPPLWPRETGSADHRSEIDLYPWKHGERDGVLFLGQSPEDGFEVRFCDAETLAMTKLSDTGIGSLSLEPRNLTLSEGGDFAHFLATTSGTGVGFGVQRLTPQDYSQWIYYFPSSDEESQGFEADLDGNGASNGLCYLLGQEDIPFDLAPSRNEVREMAISLPLVQKRPDATLMLTTAGSLSASEWNPLAIFNDIGGWAPSTENVSIEVNVDRSHLILENIESRGFFRLEAVLTAE